MFRWKQPFVYITSYMTKQPQTFVLGARFSNFHYLLCVSVICAPYYAIYDLCCVILSDMRSLKIVVNRCLLAIYLLHWDALPLFAIACWQLMSIFLNEWHSGILKIINCVCFYYVTLTDETAFWLVLYDKYV